MIESIRFKLVVIIAFCLQFVFSSPVRAICAVHDHNCFHGSEPWNPSLPEAQTGSGNLTITSTWAGEADINLNVGLPDDVDEFGNPIYGPFLASDSDGNPVTASPLGTDPNILFHDQQNVQWVSGTSTATLNSDTQAASPPPGPTLTRDEEAVIMGNIPSGTYDFALHSYNDRMVSDTASVSTVASAGTGAYFVDEGARSAAQLAAGHLPVSNATGTSTTLNYSHTLAPDGTSGTETFQYEYPGFNEHASGVYVIPDGVWNLQGVDPLQVYQFASLDRSEGFLFYGGYQYETNPYDLEQVNIFGYPDWFYDQNSGVYLAPDGYGGFERIAINPNEYNVLQTGLYTPLEIMAGYEVNTLSAGQNRGHVRAFSRDSYNQARDILGCAECTNARLVEIHQEIQSGENTYGLNSEQISEFNRNVIRGYSSASLYRNIKDDYRRDQVLGYISTGVNAVLAAYGVPVQIDAGYQGDASLGPQNFIIPNDCSTPPCNGRSQNGLAMNLGVSQFRGTDILRVDPINGTVQVNNGGIIERDIYDLGGDGKEGVPEIYQIAEGGSTLGIGAGFGIPDTPIFVGGAINTGPDGTCGGVIGGFSTEEGGGFVPGSAFCDPPRDHDEVFGIGGGNDNAPNIPSTDIKFNPSQWLIEKIIEIVLNIGCKAASEVLPQQLEKKAQDLRERQEKIFAENQTHDTKQCVESYGGDNPNKVKLSSCLEEAAEKYRKKVAEIDANK